MILLDTDHVAVFYFLDHPRYAALNLRLLNSGQEVGSAVVTLEEEMRGWLAEIKRRRDIEDQIPIYGQLIKMVALYQKWRIAPLDKLAAAEFTRLKKQKIHVGTRDLKIAAIALAHSALLLSANLRDFRQVPGLRVENWLS